jgi:cytochrome P450
MRAGHPVAYVPQLGAHLITRRDDVFENEKIVDVFSSVQPQGLMTRLMGQNMMRKDGEAHQAERRAIFPTVSPKTVRDHWAKQFRAATTATLDALAPKRACDLVRDFAMPVSAEALKAITGLTNMDWREMDRVSQGMIDGCANYAGDPKVEAHCHDCTASIDAHIDGMMPRLAANPDPSLLSVQMQAGLSQEQIRANIKLAISGGQNEPRDAIAGTAWALLSHPGELAKITRGEADFARAFEEYARWMSPIGMSPREVAKDYTLHGQKLTPGDRVFLMFGSANRDERCFDHPDAFSLGQDISAAIPFGAGPHFCAGAWAARSLIGDVALPMLFDRLPGLALDPEKPAKVGGWAFRGPLHVDVVWH